MIPKIYRDLSALEKSSTADKQACVFGSFEVITNTLFSIIFRFIDGLNLPTVWFARLLRSNEETCCSCMKPYFSLIKSHRQKAITLCDKIAFYFLPVKFELAAANKNCTIAILYDFAQAV